MNPPIAGGGLFIMDVLLPAVVAPSSRETRNMPDLNLNCNLAAHVYFKGLDNSTQEKQNKYI